MIPRGELVSLPCCSFSIFKYVILTNSVFLLKRREKLEDSLFFIITNERLKDLGKWLLAKKRQQKT
ncbi:hypothetical protein I7I53_02010 [Histoplasma capsulatum var. duboisii H88]|uniref:Uncharacterized protein n=1 Tax=Ajellomyces capsulatus (strain H88) TaxID=544711 RepID=A0A8A1LR18_AJEC8|nr:hypothetical protein I7I53_02010 [Histoplasma capsulatum var. duboisii H88]